jgi:hypothetical protein
MEALAKQGDLADEDQPARPAKLPDLTKGEEISPGKVAPQLWYLGPTGITGFMVGGFPGDQIQVQSTFKGSPADGKFLSGDVIIGMNGKKFTAGGHLGQLIGYAIIEAEKADNKGKISFLVWRDKNFNARHGKKGVNSVDVDKLFAQIQGDNSLFDWKPEQERKAEVKKMAFDEFPIIPTTLEIGLTLRVMPAYSDTAPYDCPTRGRCSRHASLPIPKPANPALAAASRRSRWSHPASPNTASWCMTGCAAKAAANGSHPRRRGRSLS